MEFCRITGIRQNDIILKFAGAPVEARLQPLSLNTEVHIHFVAWIGGEAHLIDKVAMMHVDEWSQGPCDGGLDAAAVAGLQRACEEVMGRKKF